MVAWIAVAVVVVGGVIITISVSTWLYRSEYTRYYNAYDIIFALLVWELLEVWRVTITMESKA